jgi:hypothetical protein
MKPVGGYLPFEFNVAASLLCPQAFPVNLGRTGLDLIIRQRQYRRIWLPAYICISVFNTLDKIGVEYETYALDENLEPAGDFGLSDDEALLYVDYFGVKDRAVERLAGKHKNFIADLTQAFFYQPPAGVDGFNSARKFIGVPDGGFLFADFSSELDLARQEVYGNCQHLLMRAENLTELGYPFFCANDTAMNDWSPKRISLISEKILRSISLEAIAEKRRRNFRFLAGHFGDRNELKFEMDVTTDTPLCYPLLIEDGCKWQKRLIEKKIFVPTYWPKLDSFLKKYPWEQRLVKDLICLPVDQNCDLSDMERILSVFK